MKTRRLFYHHHLRPRTLFLCVIVFLLGSCSSENSPTLPTVVQQSEVPGLPPDPGVGNLAGKIVGTISQEALGGLQVSVNSRNTISDADGGFLLNDVGSGSLAVTISGDAVYQRVSVIDTAAGRSFLLDAIERESAFNLDFYREIARGRHPTEGNLFPIQRWTGSTPPTIYIDTNAAETDAGLIDSDTLERVGDVIARIVPVFSGDVYASAPIRTRSFSSYSFDAVPDNSIVISFDDSLYLQGALGVTFTEPNFTAQATASLRKAWIFLLHNEDYYREGGISREEITAHELGHGFGYRHTSLLPSVMKKNGVYGGLFSEHDRLHMRVMYKRPFGNLDIDSDALSNGKLLQGSSAAQVFIERRPDAPESSDALAELRKSDGLAGALLSHTPSLRAVD